MRGVCRVHPKSPAGPRRWRRIMFPEVPPGNTIEDLSGARPEDPRQTQIDSGWAGTPVFASAQENAPCHGLSRFNAHPRASPHIPLPSPGSPLIPSPRLVAGGPRCQGVSFDRRSNRIGGVHGARVCHSTDGRIEWLRRELLDDT